jgi:transposase
MKEQILQLQKEGKSIRAIAAELGVGAYMIRNAIYRDKERKTASDAAKQAKELVKQVKDTVQIVRQEKERTEEELNCGSITVDLASIKHLAYFNEITTQVDRIKQIDLLQDALLKEANTLISRMQMGVNPSDKDRSALRLLLDVYSAVSSGTRNNISNIKDIFQTVAGSLQSGLIPKKAESKLADNQLQSLGEAVILLKRYEAENG